MSSKNILVKLENAGFKIKDKILVEGISLSVEKGKIVTLIGPNGSGALAQRDPCFAMKVRPAVGVDRERRQHGGRQTSV